MKTKRETLQILMMISSVHNNFLYDSEERQQMMIDVWHKLLIDIEFVDAVEALEKCLRESVFAPKPADIFNRVMNNRVPEFPDPMTEWSKVLRAVSKYGYMKSEQALETFEPLTKKVVESFGGFKYFCGMDISNEMADRAHFVKAYDRLIERETKSAREGKAGVLQLISETKKEPSQLSDGDIGTIMRNIIANK